MLPAEAHSLSFFTSLELEKGLSPEGTKMASRLRTASNRDLQYYLKLRFYALTQGHRPDSSVRHLSQDFKLRGVRHRSKDPTQAEEPLPSPTSVYQATKTYRRPWDGT